MSTGKRTGCKLNPTAMRAFISSSVRKAKWEIIRWSKSPEPVQPQNDRIWLPVELLMRIISYIGDIRHLQVLLLVSKTFKSIVEPVLYHTITISHLFKLPSLYRTLKAPRITEFVTVLEISLEYWNQCFQCRQQLRGGIIGRSASLSVTMSGTCNCDTMDQELGEIIINLKNLRVLSLSCHLTHRTGDHKHSWLANLQTHNLSELEFGCHAQYNWADEICVELLAPCMKKLTAVKLDGIMYGHMPSPWHPPRELDNLLAHIDTLAYNEHSSLHTWLVSKRSIKKVVSLLFFTLDQLLSSKLTQALVTSSSRLELLYTQNVHIWLPMQDPSPYLSLQSIGSISINSSTSESEILDYLKPLAFLNCLAFVECGIRDGDRLSTEWSQELFAQVEVQHPSLTHIYLVSRKVTLSPVRWPPALMYEKSTTCGWKKSPCDCLTYWDIATGKDFW
ncbi:hypothetical protein FRC14_008013 [Serendipita sp. 396]|nr:hypothetical protein FRC14_008013 [Serendipita sp. 396]